MPTVHKSHPEPLPQLHHASLETTFCGIQHPSSTPDTQIHQYLGIKYASVPARFRQSKLFTSYAPITDASKHGPICPQIKATKSIEESLFGLEGVDIPKQNLKQNEFECLNLNITCPAGLTPRSRLPIMLWVHGGGDRGSGSSWVYDGGALVRKSIDVNKPVILVTINFRLGLFGFAASPIIRDDNVAAGDEGVGNYGLRDQIRAMEWLHYFIGEFGGDSSNVTLFGESSGAADILCHLLSSANQTRPLFHRAIVQSAIFEHNLPDVANAGWHLSRIMAALHVTSVEQLRAIESEKLVVPCPILRAIDDGVFFRQGWRDFLSKEDAHHHHHHQIEEHVRVSAEKLHAHSRSRTLAFSPTLQPLIVGDCSSDSLLWSLPASLWSPSGVVRRVKAICQSLSKSSNLLHAYDISPYTPDEEIVDRVLDLINDARVAWPTERIVQGAQRERGGRGVWRYVFDQEGPSRGIPHHAADLMYLFDNVPLPASAHTMEPECATFCDGPFDDFDSDEEDLKFGSVIRDDEDEWVLPAVDEWSYARVRDAMQERWIAFAHGEAPWKEDKVFVFGPEGETGERSSCIFEGRRRRQVWSEALEPLGMQLVQKVGVELSRGPPHGDQVRF
ncbi:Alpha/Beta hydrolase protein [Infundibulicybe gibba]|nr:Alpha/Beta hydrolase protein [Infundibulicybe gibba]